MSQKARGSRPPNTMRVFRDDLDQVNYWIRRQYEGFVNWLFNVTQRGGTRRRNYLLAIGLIFWTGLAFLDHPIPWGLAVPDPLNFVVEVVKAYFSARVLRHVILILLAYRLAYRVASTYLGDIFELDRTGVAERFISQAAFARPYDLIVIRDGGVTPESLSSPVFRIGGPGRALLHMENAAVFEKADGTPHIISSREGYPILESFERLRQVVDLRDQVMDLNISGRSRDGILVTAKDVRLIFSVNRGRSRPKNRLDYSQPYSFDEISIKHLVYLQNGESWAKEMRELIRENFRRFIAEHTLTEFLATVSPMEEMALEIEATRSGALERVPLSDRPAVEPSVGTDEGSFIPRDRLSNLFYDFTRGFAKEAEKLGVQLQWIGLGTWVTPSAIIPEQHLEAWQLSMANYYLGNSAALHQVRSESREDELLRMIREVPITSFGRLQAEGKLPDGIVRDLLLTYRERLRNAWEIYQNSDEKPPSELDASLRHLTRLTSRWIN
ncbi:MAG TPA: hypothetical protein VJ768_09060 [Anaerolineales bacterium]|nr:hypothetical protein [Anaerolineales bacterium]